MLDVCVCDFKFEITCFASTSVRVVLMLGYQHAPKTLRNVTHDPRQTHTHTHKHDCPLPPGLKEKMHPGLA